MSADAPAQLAATDASAQPKPVPRSIHNESRYRAYKLIATEFVDGDAYDPQEIAQMLMDLRWDEVPRGFAVALYHASRRGPLRPDLGKSFRGLISLSAFQAFASTERLTVQPWVLQNWDYFFVAILDGLLLLHQKNSSLRTKIECFRRTVDGVFDMVESGRTYMSLDSAAESTGIHALLAASASSRGCFVKNGIVQIHGEPPSGEVSDPAMRRELTLAHVIFVDMVAEQILREPNRDITTWNHAFGFYVGCEAWRAFAQRCLTYMPYTVHSKNIVRLEKEIAAAHERLNESALLEKQHLNYENAHRQYMERGKKGETSNHGVVKNVKQRRLSTSENLIVVSSDDDEDEDSVVPGHDRVVAERRATRKAEAAMARVPDPRSADGSLCFDGVMEQGIAYRQALEEAGRSRPAANELACMKQINRSLASPPMLLPPDPAPTDDDDDAMGNGNAQSSSPLTPAAREALALRREHTPENKSRMALKRKSHRKRKLKLDFDHCADLDECDKVTGVDLALKKPVSLARTWDDPPPLRLCGV